MMAKVTSGSIWKNAFIFFIPIVLGSFFQHLYVVTDTIIIGHYVGDHALAAIGGSASRIITLIINFFIGISVGITSLVSRYYGKQDYKTVNNIIFNGTLVFSVCTLILTFISMFYIQKILIIINTLPESMQFATIYLRTYLLGIIFCVLYNVFAGILRAIGDSKSPFYTLIFSSFINIILNLLFFFVFKLGVFGLALATIVAQAISAALLAFILIKKNKISFRHTKFDLPLVKGIFAVGIPVGIQSIMYSLSNILMQKSINTFSFDAIVGWVSYLRIDTFVDMFVSSLSSTVITFVGQNYGANNFIRVKQSVSQIMILSYIVTICVMAVLIIFRIEILSLFTNNISATNIATRLIFIVFPMYLLSIPQWIHTQALRGLGYTFIPMIISLIGVVGFRFFWITIIIPQYPSIYLLAFGYPVNAFLLSIIFCFYYYHILHKIKIPE